MLSCFAEYYIAPVLSFNRNTDDHFSFTWFGPTLFWALFSLFVKDSRRAVKDKEHEFFGRFHESSSKRNSLHTTNSVENLMWSALLYVINLYSHRFSICI